MILSEAIKKSDNGIAVRTQNEIYHFIHRDGKNYQVYQGQINTKMNFKMIKKKGYTDWQPFNKEYILKCLK